MSDDPRRCVRCNAEIPPERIEALPETCICVQCSEDIGGEFDVRVVPGDTHKGASLKHNYSQWSVVRKRRTIHPKEPPKA